MSTLRSATLEIERWETTLKSNARAYREREMGNHEGMGALWGQKAHECATRANDFKDVLDVLRNVDAL